MSLEGARYRASLWLRQGEEDLRAARVLKGTGQYSQACFLAQQAGERELRHRLSSLLEQEGQWSSPSCRPGCSAHALSV